MQPGAVTDIGYFSEYANRRGAKSAKSLLDALLALLALSELMYLRRSELKKQPAVRQEYLLGSGTVLDEAIRV
jgi:hypothetical protein